MIDNERGQMVQPGHGPDAAMGHALPVSDSLSAMMWRRRGIVVLTTILTICCGFLYLDRATPLYKSLARVFVEQAGPRIMSDMEEGVMTQSKNYVHTQAQLLKSAPIVSAALDSLDIANMKTFQDVENVAAYLTSGCVEVTVGKRDEIITVSALSPFPEEAAEIVNALVASYIEFHSKRKRSTSAEVLKVLQKEKEKRDGELRAKLEALMDYRQNNEVMAYESEGGNIVLNRLDRLAKELTDAELSEADALAFLEMAQSLADDARNLRLYVEHEEPGRAYESGRSQEALLRERLDQLEARRAEYRVKHYQASHPEVDTLEKEIAAVNQQLADLDREYVEAQLKIAEQQVAVAKAKTKQLRQHFEEQREQALLLNKQVAQYTLLQTDWEQAKKICDILDDRIKELDVTEDVGALNIILLESARAAINPSEPIPALVLAVCLILGPMLGGSLALVRDVGDKRIRSMRDVTALLHVPILGSIPHMSRLKSRASRARHVQVDAQSRVAEAFRAIRTNVFFALPPDHTQVLQVSSPFAAVGKSTFVSNLGTAMAQSGKRVLIVDADLRHPVQHRHFECDRDRGLSSVLTGVLALDQGIQETGIEGLYLLPSGPDVSNPSELIGSDTFQEILATLKGQFDRILVDSPPIIPVTDGCIIAAVSDATLLVVHRRKTKRRALEQTRQAVLSVGGRLIGSVVNGVRRSQSTYDDYSGYPYSPYGRRPRPEVQHTGGDVVAPRPRSRPIPIQSYPEAPQQGSKASTDVTEA